MPRLIAGALAAALLAGAAAAQTIPELPLFPNAPNAATAPDEGRPREDDKSGLSARGGRNPAGTDKTFSATIGSEIYSPMNTVIGSRIGPPY